MADKYSYAAYRFAFANLRNQRIIEALQWEISFKDDLVQLPCNG